RQILLNLLGNAVKFTERGNVRIEVADNTTDVIVTVSDTGIGIAREMKEHIFEPFRQIRQLTERRGGGTGLGLAVSRQLGRLLGGELTVKSLLGEGSTFTLRLPHRR